MYNVTVVNIKKATDLFVTIHQWHGGKTCSDWCAEYHEVSNLTVTSPKQFAQKLLEVAVPMVNGCVDEDQRISLDPEAPLVMQVDSFIARLDQLTD